MVRVGLELLAEPEDVGVHGARGREALVPPHLVEEALTSEDLPPVLDEAAQRVEFLACQPDLSARSEDLPAAEVYPNVAERELLTLLSGPGRRRTARTRARSSRSENGFVT